MTETLDLRARQPKAIHSAFTVLEEVARCGAGVTAREVSDNLRMPRATTYRLLNLLVQEEYLVRLLDPAGFALGRKVSELVTLVAVPERAPQAAREVIDEMRSRIRGGVHLVRYDALSLRTVDIDPEYPLVDEPRLLRDLPTSALGRLLLAEQSFGVAAIGEDVVAETLRRGYATQVGGFEANRGCLALPIRDASGHLVAGLALSSTRDRIQQPGALLDTLVDGSRRLAPLLV